jgi:hypothetical protein
MGHCMSDGNIYRDVQTEMVWVPHFQREDPNVIPAVRDELNGIARLHHGIECHVVAGEMQNVFQRHGLN